MKKENNKMSVMINAKAPKDVETENALRKFCTDYVNSPFAKKEHTVEKLMLSLSKGTNLELPPMVSATHIYVINNKAEMMTDAMLAVVLRSGLLEDHSFTWSGEGEDRKCTYMVKRKGMSTPSYFSFSMKDAKTAGLTEKKIWQEHPEAMLRHRCQGIGLQSMFPDVLLGLYMNQKPQTEPNDNDQELKNVTEVLEQNIGGEIELHYIEAPEEIFIFKGLNNNELSKKRSEVHEYLLKVINAITSPEKFKHYQRWSRINWDEIQRYGNLEPASWKILSSEFMSKKAENNAHEIKKDMQFHQEQLNKSDNNNE